MPVDSSLPAVCHIWLTTRVPCWARPRKVGSALLLGLACAGAMGQTPPTEAASPTGLSAIPPKAEERTNTPTLSPAALPALFFTPAQRSTIDRSRQGASATDSATKASTSDLRLDGTVRVARVGTRHIVNGQEWAPDATWPRGQPLLPGQSVPADGSAPIVDLVAPGSVGRKVTLTAAELAASAPASLKLERSTSTAQAAELARLPAGRRP